MRVGRKNFSVRVNYLCGKFGIAARLGRNRASRAVGRNAVAEIAVRRLPNYLCTRGQILNVRMKNNAVPVADSRGRGGKKFYNYN